MTFDALFLVRLTNLYTLRKETSLGPPHFYLISLIEYCMLLFEINYLITILVNKWYLFCTFTNEHFLVKIQNFTLCVLQSIISSKKYFIYLSEMNSLFGISMFPEVIISIVTIILVSSFFVLTVVSQSFLFPTQVSFGTSAENMTISKLISAETPFVGNTSAPLTLVDFSDFQCYLCKRYVDNTEQQIINTYVHSGEILYVFKNLPNRGLDSMNASIAAQCANEQGQFWDYHDILYKNQESIDNGWVSIKNLKTFASTVGDLNISSFNNCLDSKKYENRIKNDVRLANSLGFTETPSFILINNKDHSIVKIQGPKPFSIFKVYIEDMLSSSKDKI